MDKFVYKDYCAVAFYRDNFGDCVQEMKAWVLKNFQKIYITDIVFSQDIKKEGYMGTTYWRFKVYFMYINHTPSISSSSRSKHVKN